MRRKKAKRSSEEQEWGNQPVFKEGKPIKT